jgi:hypothetical protein
MDNWRVIGASVQGTAHRRLDAPCQDACGWRVLDDVLIVAVADGAGSAAEAHAGAQAAVAAALDALAARACPPDATSSEGHVRAAFARALDALTTLAAQTELPLAQFACTLACAVATPDGTLTGSLGDGALVAESEGALRLVSAPPQRGEYANETHFLTQEGALERVQIAHTAGGTSALAATTDGLLRLALRLPDYAPHAPFFGPLFAFAREASDLEAAQTELGVFLDSERVNARSDDDKTLVLAVRMPAPETA